jgi:hypothetical protein
MKLEINDEQAVDIYVALDLRAQALHVLADEQLMRGAAGAGTARVYRERANRVSALAKHVKDRWYGDEPLHETAKDIG